MAAKHCLSNKKSQFSQVSVAEKPIEEFSDRNRKLVCDRLESCTVSEQIRKIRQIGKDIALKNTFPQHGTENENLNLPMFPMLA